MIFTTPMSSWSRSAGHPVGGCPSPSEPAVAGASSVMMLAAPAEIERGACYEFVLNHTIEVSTPGELFRTTISEVVHD
jgi:hypothetical protein